MPLLPLDIPPGVYRNGTALQSVGRWYDANLVRWRDGVLQPMGGYTNHLALGGTISDPVRSSHAWRTNNFTRWIAAGSANHLVAIDSSDQEYDITPASLATGYAESSSSAEATVWSLDSWGQNLLACSSTDGRIVEWTLSTGTPAAAVSGAPTGCRGLVVSDERFVFALAAGNNPRKVQWCDREDNTTWTPAATNEAGDYELEASGKIQQGLRFPGETLFLTTEDAWAAQYIGPPYVYSFRRIGEECGAISRQAGVVVDGRAFWMGRDGFYSYSGGVVERLRCDVGDYVFGDLTLDQRALIHCMTISAYSEVWWFYVPLNGADGPTKYVIYNYVDDTWNIGEVRRTSGFDAGTTQYPWMFDGTLGYKHEYFYEHVNHTPMAESGPITLGNGDQTYMVRQMITDHLPGINSVNVTFKARDWPAGAERTYGPYRETNPLDVRFTAREVRVIYEANADQPWRVGTPRLDVAPGSER